MAGTERHEDSNEGREDDELKVTDRRLFTADGRLRDDLEEEAEPAEPAAAPPEVEEPKPESEGFERRSLEDPPGVEFTMLINAMMQPALIFLGEIPHPDTGSPETNLEQARLQIDLLDLLRIRCRGNLSPEEEGLLDQILYKLRMLYVSRSNQPAP